MCHRNSRNSRAKTWEPSPGFPEQQIRDARARETDARLRGFAEQAIAAVPTSGYRYVEAVGIDNYVEKLEAGLEHVWQIGLKEHGVDPYYDPWTKTLYLDEADSFDVVRHELLHAWQHAVDLYLAKVMDGDDHELAESMTYAMNELLSATERLRKMENAIDRRDACREISHWWNQCWEHLKWAFGDDQGRRGQVRMAWREFSVWELLALKGSVGFDRPMVPADAERTMGHIGLKFSCEELRNLYNRAMYNEGILDETRPGRCCTVECPEGLPDCFK